jgi:hypothetical protein
MIIIRIIIFECGEIINETCFFRDGGNIDRFLIEVDRLTSGWNLSERDVLNRAFHELSVH